MELVKNNVTFWPGQERKVKLGDLATKIIRRSKDEGLTNYTKFVAKEKNKLLRRLYHIAYKTRNDIKFPLYIDQTIDKDGNAAIKSSKMCFYEVNIRKAYNEILLFFKEEGFDCGVKEVKSRYGYDLELIIKGVSK